MNTVTPAPNITDQLLYIVFSSTSTKIGSLIRIVTRYRYNHISIAFDRDLKEMYSYSRYKAASPLVGGFVKETPLRFTLDNKKEVLIKLCSVPVTEQAYSEIHKFIDELKSNESECLYNIFSAILYPVHKGIEIKNSYSCVGFAAKVLKLGGILQQYTHSYEFTISDLESLLDKYNVYEGKLCDFDHASIWNENDFFNRENIILITVNSIKQFFRLLYHALFIRG